MKKILLSVVVLTLMSFSAFSQSQDQNNKKYFDINQNIEIFNSILKELDMFYVDSLDVNKTVGTGIDAMLESLDPYTNYISEDMMGDFRFMTTGEYAGIGSIISYKNGHVIINEPYENMPAAKAGLKAGDVILSIDGVDMSKATTSDVSEKLKGQQGSVLVIKVERPGSKKPLEFKVVRENILVNSVPYYGILGKSTGYIALNSFTDKSADEVKKAFLDLKKQGITSLMIDLRDNGGGIMEQAIQIVNLFVPKGKIVLTTKGKVKQWDRTYRTTIEPIDTDIPLAVLVNKGSASASEILSGALQDMDRAVIIGTRTFGKGLVQTTRDLPYGGSLKVTTSKYYTPSGRCVQAIDYSHRNEDGSVGQIPDSLTSVFKTANGRSVRDGGGITPDVTMADEKPATISYYLLNQYMIFDFVTEWAQKHPKIAPIEQFSISDADYDNFKQFVKSKNFTYDRISEKTMNTLKEVMDFEGYMKTAGPEFKALQAKLVPDLDRDLTNFKPDITKLINLEIAKRYYFKRGEAIENLKTDKTSEKAVEVLNDSQKYKGHLSPPAKSDDSKVKELSMSLRKTHHVTMTDIRQKVASDITAQPV
ncbi:MAG: S41 family peptidase [Dysgonamonadaceae bacterium]